tara:strand:- start:7 stop:771 length:765 start_codon:yes stop_codon:yes gene_type:complete
MTSSKGEYLKGNALINKIIQIGVGNEITRRKLVQECGYVRRMDADELEKYNILLRSCIDDETELRDKLRDKDDNLFYLYTDFFFELSEVTGISTNKLIHGGKDPNEDPLWVIARGEDYSRFVGEEADYFPEEKFVDEYAERLEVLKRSSGKEFKEGLSEIEILSGIECVDIEEIGEIKIEQNNLKDALLCYQKIISETPENWKDMDNETRAKYYLKIGELKKELGDTKDACRNWTKALELGDEDAEELLLEHCE